jgi:Na+-translocating ferredoxin:NAD+ oxidoreductase subunit B
MPDLSSQAPETQALFLALNNALPQTQCTRCGYPDCASYALAMAEGQAPINQCPPGGQAGIERLAALTGRPAVPLNPEHGQEGPRHVAIIDEAWCIGCTLCIKACPTDAILGANKLMHTVIEPWCTGCELCIPVCPVDCIALENVTGAQTGWSAWSAQQADTARGRYASRQQRLVHVEAEHQKHLQAKAEHKLADLAEHTKGTDNAPEVDRKRAIIEAALAKAKARQAGT